MKLSQQFWLLSKSYRDDYILYCKISFTLLFFSFNSNIFLVFHSLVKCQNIVGKTCDNWISPNRYSILWDILYVCKYADVCMWVCVFVHPSWVFLKNFAYFTIYSVNGCFQGTALSGCFNILRILFILILRERNVFWRALLASGFLINIWCRIRYLLNINSALVISKGFFHRWLIYWHNALINLQFL